MPDTKPINITNDPQRRLFFVNGEDIYLSPSEYRVLEKLHKNLNQAIRKKDLHECLYDGEVTTHRKIIDVIICRLRRKIANIAGDNLLIDTIWGYGYILTDESRN